METQESCVPSPNSRATLEGLRSGSAEWVGTITLCSTVHSFYSLRKILERKRATRRPAGPQAPVRSGPALTHSARVSFKIRSREKKLRTYCELETRRKVRKKAPLLLPQVSRTSATAARCDSRASSTPPHSAGLHPEPEPEPEPERSIVSAAYRSLKHGQVRPTLRPSLLVPGYRAEPSRAAPVSGVLSSLRR